MTDGDLGGTPLSQHQATPPQEFRTPLSLWLLEFVMLLGSIVAAYRWPNASSTDRVISVVAWLGLFGLVMKHLLLYVDWHGHMRALEFTEQLRASSLVRSELERLSVPTVVHVPVPVVHVEGEPLTTEQADQLMAQMRIIRDGVRAMAGAEEAPAPVPAPEIATEPAADRKFKLEE